MKKKTATKKQKGIMMMKIENRKTINETTGTQRQESDKRSSSINVNLLFSFLSFDCLEKKYKYNKFVSVQRKCSLPAINCI